METLCLTLNCFVSFSISLAASFSRRLFPPFSKIQRFPIFVPVIEALLALYFSFFCGLVQCTVDLDDQTTMHFWAPRHRRFNKRNLLMIHGFGGNSKWQFVYQIGALSDSFNVYIPDLLFFGESFTNRRNRTESFQAECVGSGLKRLGVESCSVYAISYGGYVCCRMAEIYPEMVEKMVIVSSGVGCAESLKKEQLNRVGFDAVDVLLPEKPVALRLLVKLSINKVDPFKWVPDFILDEFIDVMCNTNRKEKQELVEHLLKDSAEYTIQTMTQETLLVWGDKDNIFPLNFAHHLQRNLGSNSKLEIIQDAGHAANIDAPDTLNDLIQGFILK